MQTDAMWQAFARTGDPVYYLLYKAAEGDRSGPQKEKSAQKTQKKQNKTPGPGPRC